MFVDIGIGIDVLGRFSVAMVGTMVEELRR